MQGMQLFFYELYGFLEFVCVYYSTILGFCAIISVFVLGVIMTLRSSLFSRMVFGKGVLWCMLIPVIFCGKLHAYYSTPLGVKVFYRWYALFSTRWISALYFAGMIFIGTLLVVKRRGLSRMVNRLYESGKYSSDYAMKEYPGRISSFCMGCLKPTIVISEDLLEDDAAVIIKHEETHIQLGHLWILLAYDILRVLLWPNVFLHLCVRFLKRDLEDICDAVTIQRNSIEISDYGKTLLRSAGNMAMAGRKPGPRSGMSFAWDDDYKVLKRRLERIVGRKAYSVKAVKVLIAVVALLVVATTGVIKANSYARVNDIGEVSSMCFSNDTDSVFVDYDKAIVTGFDDEYIYVDSKALLDQYPEAERADGFFYFSVGGYYKIPGIGGGGGWGELEAKDIQEGILKIPNHTEIDIWNRIIMWL